MQRKIFRYHQLHFTVYLFEFSRQISRLICDRNRLPSVTLMAKENCLYVDFVHVDCSKSFIVTNLRKMVLITHLFSLRPFC